MKYYIDVERVADRKPVLHTYHDTVLEALEAVVKAIRDVQNRELCDGYDAFVSVGELHLPTREIFKLYVKQE